MKIAHDQIIAFMKRYFAAYNTIAQDSKTIHLMNEYYAPELKVAVYTPKVAVSDRQRFLSSSSSHPGIQETLIPEHIIVDDMQYMVAVLLRGEFTFKDTGKTIRQMFSAHYQLKLDEKNSFKIVSLWIFGQYVAHGEKTIFEIYADVYRKLKSKKK